MHMNHDDEEELIGPPRPAARADSDDDVDESEPAVGSKTKPDDDDSNSDITSDEEGNDMIVLPTSHVVSIEGHSKSVSALAIDVPGARMLSGSHDYSIMLRDFEGMDAKFRAFREIEATAGYPVKALDWSPDSMSFICATGKQAKVFNRDGREQCEFIRGDMYLYDKRKTKGHVADLTSAAWHPRKNEELVTCSIDGTCRVWDAYKTKEQKHVMICKRSGAGAERIAVTAVSYSRDGSLIACATDEGLLQVWPSAGTSLNPSHANPNAHERGSITSSVRFSYDGHTLRSRGGDDSLKVWDIRKFNEPVREFFELPNVFPETDCGFSPDERVFFTGLSVKKGEDKGRIVLFDRKALDPIGSIAVSEGSVIRATWHPRLNQIFMGCADSKIHVFYSPEVSQRGVLVGIGRGEKKKIEDDAKVRISFGELPTNRREMTSKKRQQEKARKDPVASRKPEAPIKGKGTQGKLGTSFTAQLMKQMITPDVRRDQDPQQALLQNAERASKNPMFTKAYNQGPVAKEYAMPAKTLEQEEEEFRERFRKKQKTT
eukprot:TRINITY_DN12653_c0_g1::TRINITY_DN12653_c0_g1_i1::g.13561::m.13561 TRINITY_DN12653_c0_g1::TRINITY_DN12653_c0_g1_i1::g.13561  ORF type:complete len:545 (+),score=98.66,sp/Q32LB0/WDR70_BOVIN/37.55/1e-109,WD40/PF00400.27/0.0069,WD40/PF00400.27/14,WD40/PF00400.27/2.4e-06,WD40/PF00400.27/1,WD40/PF00400.27/57,WD40/PF00400.27/7e+02,WD40/PF00400.27/13 TRINITY_DN12653_c0_g1_i1:3-1637(+)